MDSENKTENTEKKGGRRGVVIVIGIVVLAVIAGIIIFMLLNKKPVDESRKVIAPDTAEDVVKEILTPNDSNIPKSYTVTQNSEWVFPDGKSESTNAYVENDKENETDVYFDLIEDESGEVIYSSPVLQRGAAVENFKLDKALDAGSYNCTVEYHLVDDKQNTLTTTSVGVSITILK